MKKIIMLVILFEILFLGSCAPDGSPIPDENLSPQILGSPQFSHTSGSYPGPLYISIISGQSNASIIYTMDGSTPSPTNGIFYSNTLTINSSVTLKAVSCLTGWIDSAPSEAIYSILLPITSFRITNRLWGGVSATLGFFWMSFTTNYGYGGKLSSVYNQYLNATEEVTGDFTRPLVAGDEFALYWDGVVNPVMHTFQFYDQNNNLVSSFDFSDYLDDICRVTNRADKHYYVFRFNGTNVTFLEKTIAATYIHKVKFERTSTATGGGETYFRFHAINSSGTQLSVISQDSTFGLYSGNLNATMMLSNAIPPNTRFCINWVGGTGTAYTQTYSFIDQEENIYAKYSLTLRADHLARDYAAGDIYTMFFNEGTQVPLFQITN